MRDKEAIELERKTLGRHLEKQMQTLDKLVAQEKNSTNLVVCQGSRVKCAAVLTLGVFVTQKEMEVELVALRETKALQQTKILDLDRQRKWYQDRADSSRKYVEEACLLQDSSVSVTDDILSRRRRQFKKYWQI